METARKVQALSETLNLKQMLPKNLSWVIYNYLNGRIHWTCCVYKHEQRCHEEGKQSGGHRRPRTQVVTSIRLAVLDRFWNLWLYQRRKLHWERPRDTRLRISSRPRPKKNHQNFGLIRVVEKRNNLWSPEGFWQRRFDLYRPFDWRTKSLLSSCP